VFLTPIWHELWILIVVLQLYLGVSEISPKFDSIMHACCYYNGDMRFSSRAFSPWNNFYARCYRPRQNAVMPKYVVCPSVGLSVCLWHSGMFLRATACYSAYMLSPVRLSVRPCVTQVDQSKTVEVRMMQLSPPSSPMTLSFLVDVVNFTVVNFTAKFQRKGNIGSGDAK